MLTFETSFSGTKPNRVTWGLAKTRYGPVVIGITEEGALCRLSFAQGRKATTIVDAWQHAWTKTTFHHDDDAAARIAKRAFGAKRGTVSVFLSGTPFQCAVWKALLTIPAGKVVSYGAIARQIRKPKAVRAVGTALGKNPVPILVPCHRVISGNGSLGGYTGGLAIKRSLLKQENIEIS